MPGSTTRTVNTTKRAVHTTRPGTKKRPTKDAKDVSAPSVDGSELGTQTPTGPHVHDTHANTPQPSSDMQTGSEELEQPYKAGAVVRKSKKNKKHPWGKIEEFYVEGHENSDGSRSFPSVSETARYWGIPRSRVGEHAAGGRWTEKRAVFQNRLTDQRQREVAKQLGKEAVDLDSRALNTAKLGLHITMGRLSEIGKDMTAHQAKRAELEELIEQGMPVSLLDLRSPVNYREMEALGKAAMVFHEMGRTALGENVVRHEVSGVGGEPIQQVIDIRAEMGRDDPERMSKLIEAIIEARLIPELVGDTSTSTELARLGEADDDIEDAETVDDDNEEVGN